MSAVLTESLAEQKRLAALRDVLAWMQEGRAPLSAEELAAASRELGLTVKARKHPSRGKGTPRRRM